MKKGKVIADIRREKGLKQYQLAKKAGISQTYLSQIESGKREAENATLRRIVKALDVPMPVLLFKSMEESDVKPKLKEVFNSIQPKIAALINELIVSR